MLADIRSLAGTGPSAADALGAAAANESLVTRLSGDFGDQSEPVLASFYAEDPDNSGLDYGAGDTLTVTFSKPTNRDVATDERRYVDSLFSFEPDIGDDYSGEWLDDSTFLVTVLTAGAHAPALNASRAAVRGDIFGREQGRQVARGSGATLTGSYGRAAPPKVASFVVSDPEQRAGSGVGDAYTIRFDIPTNRGHYDPTANASLGQQFNDQHGMGYVGNWSSSGGMDYVGSLFAFSQPLGLEYSGGWMPRAARTCPSYVARDITVPLTSPERSLLTLG